MSKPLNTDVFVAGNGPAGMAAAIALANEGFAVTIASPEQSRVDYRTTALMMPSILMLKKLGIWRALQPNAAPMRAMRILDGTTRLVRSRPVTFHAAEIDEEAFGYNIPNAHLNGHLAARLADLDGIRTITLPVAAYEMNDDGIIAIFPDGQKVSSKLVVAADGRNSLARAQAGIKVNSWSYPQAAFVTTFRHRLPHHDISTEFHTETGPCTQVPLSFSQSSLVWVVTAKIAADLSAMDDAGLSFEIEQRIQSILGRVEVGPHRQVFPLSGQYPNRFAQNRTALVGEAAHVFPPIGAQGLNLGLRDVEDLVKAATGNPADAGAPAVMASYDAMRRPDILARTSAVDSLNRTLLSSFLPAQLARAAGIALLDTAPPLRALFMREGMRPGAGLGAMLKSVREKIGRKVALGDQVKQSRDGSD